MNEEGRRSKTSTLTAILLVAAALGTISMIGAPTVAAQSWPGPAPNPPPYGGQCQHSWDPQCQPWYSQCQHAWPPSAGQPPYGQYQPPYGQYQAPYWQNQCRNGWYSQCHYGWSWGWGWGWAPWYPNYPSYPGYPNQGYPSQCQPWNSQCQHTWPPSSGLPPYQQPPYWGQGQQPPYQCWGNQCCHP